MESLKKFRLRKDRFKIGLLGIVCLIGLWGIIATNGDDGGGVTPGKPYVLGYIDTDWKIRVRVSDDGSNWTTATMGRSGIDRGPGITCDDSGITYLTVFHGSASEARYNMGIGPSIWDNSSSQIGDGHRGLIASGTSLAHLNGTKYLATFIVNNRAKTYVFDTANTSRDFTNEVTPVQGVTNNNLEDRPAIIRRGDTILTGWVTNNNKLELVMGDISSGLPVWNTGYEFTNTESGFYGPEAVMDLATDGEKFYLALLRKGNPPSGGTFYPFEVFIYTSENGLNWQKLTSHPTINIRISALSIAASGPNEIISVESGGLRNKVMRYNGSTWGEIPNAQVFGDTLNNVGHDLTLFRRY